MHLGFHEIVEHGKWLFKNSKMSPEKIHIQRKLETGKYTFDRHKNNTTMVGLPHFKKKCIFIQFFISNAGECPAKNEVFLTCSLSLKAKQIFFYFFANIRFAKLHKQDI